MSKPKVIVKHIYSCRGCMSCNTVWHPTKVKYFCDRTGNVISDVDDIPDWCPLEDARDERSE